MTDSLLVVIVTKLHVSGRTEFTQAIAFKSTTTAVFLISLHRPPRYAGAISKLVYPPNSKT